MEQTAQEYRPPSSFYHETEGPTQHRMKCTKTKCKMCIITTGICTLGVLLMKYLLDKWSTLENIS